MAKTAREYIHVDFESDKPFFLYYSKNKLELQDMFKRFYKEKLLAGFFYRKISLSLKNNRLDQELQPALATYIFNTILRHFRVFGTDKSVILSCQFNKKDYGSLSSSTRRLVNMSSSNNPKTPQILTM